MEKRCRMCGETKPITEFYSHPKMADGHLHDCKECFKGKMRTQYHRKMKDPNWVEQERKRHRAKNKAARTAGKPWANSPRDPVKRAANVILNNALRDGRIIPAESCEVCGHDFSFYRREAHHDDYAKPLEVRWVCSKCHPLLDVMRG